jgi:NADH-quinone oxidoreductase subunit J
MVEALLFWVFAGLALFSAFAVVTCRSILYSTLSLIIVFLSIAAFFVMNNADFLAIAQLIVYAVGLTIIVLFGVMFTGDALSEKSPATSAGQGPAPKILFAVVSTMVGGLLIALLQTPFTLKAPSAFLVKTLIHDGSTALLARLLFNQYAIPFELASILLLVAMIGAIILAKKHIAPSEGSPTTVDLTRLPINLASKPNVTDAGEVKERVLVTASATGESLS